MTEIPFIKMHGLGNDFVVIDGRSGQVACGMRFDQNKVKSIADRRTGIGCDQFIVVEDPRVEEADAFMRIYNSDGGEVHACGNATRCVGSLLLGEKNKEKVFIETNVDLLEVESKSRGEITANMGLPKFDWEDVPLRSETDTLYLSLDQGPLSNPSAVNVGNPHVTFFVEKADTIDLASLGPIIENNSIFPERANIGIAEIVSSSYIRLRVWERGVGITLACGTAACAAAVNGYRRKLTQRKVIIGMDGGELSVDWNSNGQIYMTGPVAKSFLGQLLD